MQNTIKKGRTYFLISAMALINIKQYIEYIRFLWMQIFIAVGTIVCLAWGSFFLALMYLIPADPRIAMDRFSIGWAPERRTLLVGT